MVNPIEVRGLRKSYGDFEAVRGIDFEVAPGEVFGLLGPNGAGKTTTVEILEGLRPRTAGEASVLGFDPGVEVRALKDRIGVCLQATNLPDKITVREALQWFAAFYSRHADCDHLIDRLQLSEKAQCALRQTFRRPEAARRAGAGSGERAGSDLPGRAHHRPRSAGPPGNPQPDHGTEASKRTILLTTHYIEEAERLCDRVAIVDQGRVIAIGTPREIQAQTLGQSRIEIRTVQPMPPEVPAFDEAERSVLEEERKLLTVHSRAPARTLPGLIKWIDQCGVDLEDIHLNRPTLEDVFIELTGKRLRE